MFQISDSKKKYTCARISGSNILSGLPILPKAMGMSKKLVGPHNRLRFPLFGEEIRCVSIFENVKFYSETIESQEEYDSYWDHTQELFFLQYYNYSLILRKVLLQ